MIIPEGIKITPWLEQYLTCKEQYPDALLLFRMGDFYELFFDDARDAASLLDIALTSRDQEKKIPMAGVPHHALNMYLSRMIKAGKRVAICDQVGESDGKTIVERRVVRVVTPGTYVPEENDVGGHLAAVMPLKNGFLAVALLSTETGRLEAGSLPEGEAVALLTAFSPGEVLYPSTVRTELLPSTLKNYSLLPQPAELFKPLLAAGRLKTALVSERLESFGFSEDDPSLGTAWAVLDYLSSTQFSTVRHVLQIYPLQSRSYMYLDEAAQKNLELMPEFSSESDRSLFSCLNNCRTPMGRRTLREWLSRPLLDIKAIRKRQDAIGALIENPALLSDLQDVLLGCRDIERALSRLSLKNGTPRDLGAIRDTLRRVPQLNRLSFPESLRELLELFPDFSELSAFLDGALEEELPRVLNAGRTVRSDFDSELASWREVAENGEAWLVSYLEKEREATGSPRLKAGYNKVFGYYLEIGRTGLETIPSYYERRQTLVNSERFVTPELREFQDKMERSEGEIARIEGSLYQKIIERIISEGMSIQLAGRLLGLLDCTASLARIARERNYTRPEIDSSSVLDIRGGRHPVLETTLTDSSFVPNDVLLGEDGMRIAILTGPNMAGKSTWLRMAALLSIMAQAGAWVPAESARFGLIDRVFTRIGARDDLVRGNSTFMVEMLETAGILHNITDRSLVILDEVGRGTATWDGMSIAWAVLEYLHHDCGAAPKVLFATHYHELTCLEERLPGVKNLSMAVSEGQSGILFLHQVVQRPADRSYGIEVARLAGLPQSVLRRAFELLELFEKEGFERSAIPEALPLNHLRQQLSLFSPETDAVVEELAELDVDNLSPMRALEILYKMKEKSRKAIGQHS